MFLLVAIPKQDALHIRAKRQFSGAMFKVGSLGITQSDGERFTGGIPFLWGAAVMVLALQIGLRACFT